MSTVVGHVAETARRALLIRQAKAEAECIRLFERIAAIPEGAAAGPDDVAALSRLMEPGGLPESLRATFTNRRRGSGLPPADHATEEELNQAVGHLQHLAICLDARKMALRAKEDAGDENAIKAELTAARNEMAAQMAKMMKPVHELEMRHATAVRLAEEVRISNQYVREATNAAPWLAKAAMQ